MGCSECKKFQGHEIWCSYACESCSGEGTIPESLPCLKCKAKGYIPDRGSNLAGDRDLVCPDCDGYRKVTEYKDCGKCYGSGEKISRKLRL